MQRAKHARRSNANSHAIHNSVDDIRDHAVGIGGDLRDIGDAVKNVLIEKFTDLLRRAVSLGERGTEAARDLASNAREEVEERVQDNPYKSMLIATGVGVVLGFLLLRRR